ncbi:MAG: S41 family peptidase [Gemmatimonadaceae bacterium]
MKAFSRIAAFAGLAIAAGCGGARSPDVAGAPDEALEPGIAVASFDSLWKIVADTYVDTAFVSSRWVTVRDSLRPRSLAITRRRELDALLGETLNTISDSHFYIIPARLAPADSGAKSDGRGATGLVVRVAEGRAVAWRVNAGSPADRAGIKPGQTVVRVASRDPAEGLDRLEAMPEQAKPRALFDVLQRLNGALAPRVGDTVAVVMRVDGKSATHRLVAVKAEGTLSQYANLPPISGVVKWSRLPIMGGGCAGTITFNIWLPALMGELDRAVDSVRSCKGVVIDLRGNPGGLGAMVMGFGGHFVDSVKSLGTMKMRQLSLNFVINPQRSRNDGSSMAPFSGPVAILVDPMTASTSEIFAAGMQRIGRARVFGQRSAGAALPALMNRLPSDDVFVHAVADFTDPEGRRIEGSGAEPDVEVPLSVGVLSEGRDGPMEEALRWISGR